MERRGSRLTRRQFVVGGGMSAAGLGLIVGCGRLPWQPEPPAHIYRLGYPRQQIRDAVREGLRQLRHVEGANLLIKCRDPAGRADRLPQPVPELVALPVDIIVAPSTATVIAARAATSVIPIVSMGRGGDLVEFGL